MAEIIIVKEKLRQLRASADWDFSMVSLMNLWEKQIAWAEDNEESFYRLPKVVELANLLDSRLAYIDKELQGNRTLTTSQRQTLFIEKDITEIELSIFKYSDALDGIEKAIDFEADVFAKKQDDEDAIDSEDNLR